MPYITGERRAALWDGDRPRNKGDLTYLLYLTAVEWLQNGEKNFDRRADAIAALECAKLEFYRRHLAPYEDIKIKENGDVG